MEHILRVDKSDNYQLLLKEIENLYSLNPDLELRKFYSIYEVAKCVDSSHFEEFSHHAECLIANYLSSSYKFAERTILGDYFTILQDNTKRLVARGDLPKHVDDRIQESSSVALAPSNLYSQYEWCTLIAKSDIPMPVINAVDACQKRNRLLNSVVEIILRVLLEIDEKLGLRWQLDYLRKNEDCLDHDILRDMLSAWLTVDILPREALAYVEKWSGDDNLQRQWPSVVCKANRVLRKHALRSWLAKNSVNTGVLAHLALLIKKEMIGDKKLLRWLESSMIKIADAIEFFIALSTTKEKQQDWQQAALLREIRTISELFEPIMLLSDLILAMPSGAFSLAMTIFGLTGSGKVLWQERLEKQARKAVLRMFLNQLRLHKTPVEVIKRLSFGDEEFYNRLISKLDILSHNFDSLDVRNWVADKLAVYYASYREPQLIAMELSKRYRNLMRVVHEDNLRRLITEEQFKEVCEYKFFQEISTIASEARKFLNKRKSTKSSLEQLLAVEMDYISSANNRRLAIIHRLLDNKYSE